MTGPHVLRILQKLKEMRIPRLGQGGVPRSGGAVGSRNRFLSQHHPGNCSLYKSLLAVLLAASVASAEPVQGGGTVTGRVTRTGTSDGIGGVKVTLASGPVDPLSLRALSTAGYTIGFFIPGPADP
jgi:hypothetical protein